MAQRHDGVRNLLTLLAGKVCTNVEVELQLQPLNNERVNLRSAVTSPEARLDPTVGGFWSRGVTAFFDVRVRMLTPSVTRNLREPRTKTGKGVQDKKYPYVIHAEQNALMMRNTKNIEDGTLFVTKTPFLDSSQARQSRRMRKTSTKRRICNGNFAFLP